MLPRVSRRSCLPPPAPAHRPLAARRRWRIDTAGYWVISSREKRVGLAARQHQRYQGCAESGIASRLAPKERLGASGLTRTLCDARARASAGRMHGRSRESRLPKGAQPRGRGAGPPCARRWPTRQTAGRSRIFRSRQPRVRPLLASSLGACVYIGP